MLYWGMPLYQRSQHPLLHKANVTFDSAREYALAPHGQDLDLTAFDDKDRVTVTADPQGFALALFYAAAGYLVTSTNHAEFTEGFAVKKQLDPLSGHLSAILKILEDRKIGNRLAIGYSALSKSQTLLSPTIIRSRYPEQVHALRAAQFDEQVATGLQDLNRSPLGFIRALMAFEETVAASNRSASALKSDVTYFKEAVSIPFIAYHNMINKRPMAISTWGGSSAHSRGVNYLRNCFDLLRINIGKNAIAKIDKNLLKECVPICERIITEKKSAIAIKRSDLTASEALDDLDQMPMRYTLMG